MRKVAFALAFGLIAVPAAAQPQQTADRDADRILLANADGSWTITRDIAEEPHRLSIETEELVLDEDEPAARDARRMRRSEQERALEEAFEEAVEWSRRTDPQ